MRRITFHEETKTFHLYNERIRYIFMCIKKMDIWDNYIFGKRLHDKANFSYLVEKCERTMTSYIYEWDHTFIGTYSTGISGLRYDRLQTSGN